ncbi:MAG TPA: hypothetical protein VGQ53_03655 [Chitinophagaceae bacterium]|nr:hypothetical protein [Chitinophagaceae bacterium]
MVLGTYYNLTVTAIGYIKVLAASKLITGFDILKALYWEPLLVIQQEG